MFDTLWENISIHGNLVQGHKKQELKEIFNLDYPILNTTYSKFKEMSNIMKSKMLQYKD